jgi:hypothetical protein
MLRAIRLGLDYELNRNFAAQLANIEIRVQASLGQAVASFSLSKQKEPKKVISSGSGSCCCFYGNQRATTVNQSIYARSVEQFAPIDSTDWQFAPIDSQLAPIDPQFDPSAQLAPNAWPQSLPLAALSNCVRASKLHSAVVSSSWVLTAFSTVAIVFSPARFRFLFELRLIF